MKDGTETDDAMRTPGTGLPNCYSMRRANPFLGLVAVVRINGARALSFDGLHWQMQVAAHPPRGLWSGGGHDESPRYFHFGVWSAADGLTHVPLNPILNIGQMLEASERLQQATAEASKNLPFPLAPELELWLLDTDHKPLALLATALDLQMHPDDSNPRELNAGLEEIGRPEWNAGGRGERAFCSPTLRAQGIPEHAGGGSANHPQVLERWIMQAAGSQRVSQWFRRDAEGATCIGLDTPRSLIEHRLANAEFPRFHLRHQWSDAKLNALVNDYMQWLSPYLLMLPDLEDAQRAEMEQAAGQHAMEVAKLWRLYPRETDMEFVRRARVEAEIRRARS
ncbi:MAG TPA: hypothetical protein DDY14_04800 [Chromatiaceae bacterium]|nr:MAG: hypothetical protein N838_03180 [Thiohalocapsa sp. PB-PSB1]QQO53140.1 MAG: hypothetical protein N838_06970 [Thiohalocapsa sp. PB-PSB1]HBG94643.1 hypothetical protein [Chromatiaceae bacterium]HCS92093.1 hypothetical protein [Chromatiaceae bacterium]